MGKTKLYGILSIIFGVLGVLFSLLFLFNKTLFLGLGIPRLLPGILLISGIILKTDWEVSGLKYDAKNKDQIMLSSVIHLIIMVSAWMGILALSMFIMIK